MNYSMGFKINGTAIPNPSSFSGKESDLDTMGERDANGYLHRNRVATKHPLNLEYKNITWDTIQTIGSLLTNDKFTFTFPNPFSSSATDTIDAYVGDRDFDTVWSPEVGDWIGNLKFSVIEY